MLNQVIRMCGLSAIAGISLFGTVSGQALPGKRDSILSTILNEKRIIQVVLPEKYKPGSTDKYDVVYVLDGDWNTQLAKDMSSFLQSESYAPPVIIVGVLNVDRDRDLTPTHVADNTTSGGAGKFLSFLKNELVPYVTKTYPADGENVLFGHSFGGLFVTYALLNEPQVFNSYIAADPSFWWDKNYLNKIATDKLPLLANLNKTLYISGREGDAYKGMGIVAMDSILKTKAPAGFTWKDLAYPDETHGSVRLKSMYDGLKFTYAGFNTKVPQFHPMAGVVLKDKPIKIWYFDDPSALRYTTDGTEPTLASPKMRSEIDLPGPGKLSVKQFSSRARYDAIATGEFKAGKPWPALSAIKGSKAGGLHYAYYEGAWDKLPDFSTMKPIREGIADKDFSVDKLSRKDNFALRIQGWIEIKDDGYYIFGIMSDDGSKFYLNNQLLLDNDGLHDSNGVKSYIVPLQKGFYPVRVDYFQKDGGRNLNLVYITPSTISTKKPAPVPFELLYSR